MFKYFINEYFAYSKSARRGIWVLIILIVIILLTSYIYPLFLNNSSNTLDSLSIKQFDKALIELNKQNTSYVLADSTPFDPNRLSKTGWVKLGVSNKTAENIEKYIKKGGCFHKKEDILKIYGFDTSLFLKLSPLFIFPKKETVTKIFHKSLKRNIEKVELNTADTLTLDSLHGVGKVLSARIIKYRNLLGGFYKSEQLLEVYGLKKDIFEKIKDQIKADSILIIKIDLNIATVQQLSKHPYIGKYDANAIVKYRNFNKGINNKTELLTNGLITKEKFEKLIHYLK